MEDLSDRLQILQGMDFEAMLFEQLRAQLGDQFIELEGGFNPAPTAAALTKNPIVLAQPFFEKDYGNIFLTGFADLLVREDHSLETDYLGNLIAVPNGESGTKYTVWDVKHSKEAKPNYKLQVGAYIEMMRELGICSDKPSGLLLRNRNCVGFDPDELLADYVEARKNLFDALNENPPHVVTSAAHITWHCETPGTCGAIYCEYPKLCAADRIELDMLNQIYDIRQPAVDKLVATGWPTVAELAEMPANHSVPGIDDAKLAVYRNWAEVIQWQKETGKPELALTKSPDEIRAMIPQPHPGDLFFDLEWFTPAGESVALQYLFGVVDRSQTFTPFVAHDFESERKTFEKFVNWATEHLKANPGAHIYHFNWPETKNLSMLADRHAFYGDEVAALIEHMFDLLPVVRSSMINGYGSLGIKTLEHFYDPKHATDDGLRGDTDVADGADSQLVYYKYLKALEAGHDSGAALLHEGLLAYNQADCVSTLLLYGWLQSGLNGYRMAGEPPSAKTSAIK
jgi:uncharacterized protein